MHHMHLHSHTATPNRSSCERANDGFELQRKLNLFYSLVANAAISLAHLSTFWILSNVSIQ